MITLKGNIANLEGTSSDQKPNNVPVNTIFRELDTNCSYYFTGEAWVEIPSSGGGGGGGTDSYNDLENKPQINSVTLSGNKSLANLGIQGELTFDNSPTEDSTNPVTSGGVYSALETKQNTLTIDSIPTESSTNPVESGGVYNALGNKQDTLTFDGTYNASTNKAATESTVSGAVSTAIGNLSKSDVGLDNVTNNAQVKAVSGSVTNGGIATFGADGATVADSGKTIETSLTDTNDKLPTSKAIRDNVAANATLASGYTVDTSETSITSSTKINDAIEQLDYRTATNKTNTLSDNIISTSFTWSGGYISTGGHIFSSSQSYFSQPFTLHAGEKIVVRTKNKNICIIGSTTADSVAVGDNISIIRTTSATEQYETYDYIATEDIKIVICVLASDYVAYTANHNATTQLGSYATAAIKALEARVTALGG